MSLSDLNQMSPEELLQAEEAVELTQRIQSLEKELRGLYAKRGLLTLQALRGLAQQPPTPERAALIEQLCLSLAGRPYPAEAVAEGGR